MKKWKWAKNSIMEFLGKESTTTTVETKNKEIIFNKNNFFVSTRATWKCCKLPKRDPDYISNSGSQYWYTPLGVYRKSDHWSQIYIKRCNTYEGCIRISKCYWILKILNNNLEYDCYKSYINRETQYGGFCRWDNFKPNDRLR